MCLKVKYIIKPIKTILIVACPEGNLDPVSIISEVEGLGIKNIFLRIKAIKEADIDEIAIIYADFFFLKI